MNISYRFKNYIARVLCFALLRAILKRLIRADALLLKNYAFGEKAAVQTGYCFPSCEARRKRRGVFE